MNFRFWSVRRSDKGANLIVTTIGLTLIAKISDSREIVEQEWKHRPLQLDDTVASGIRELEHLRKLVIEDSRFGKSANQQFLPINDRRSYQPGYIEDSFGGNVFAGEKYKSRRQVNTAMFDGLSKLANVRFANPFVDETSKPGILKNEHFEKRNYHGFDQVEKNLAEIRKKNSDESEKRRNESSTSIEGKTKVTGDSGLIERKFQCTPIHEIYIPNVDKKMPAYLCALGKRAFVVSSERFNHESRKRFFVSLDDETYMRLNPIRSGSTTLTSAVSVLPATLVLKHGDGDYIVRGIDN